MEVPKISTVEAGDEFKRLVFRYLAPPPRLVVRAPLMFRASLVVGPMGSGKTTFVRNKLGEVVEHLLGLGVDEHRICYVYAREAKLSQIVGAATSLDLPQCLYLYIFNDDAPVHAHSRRAMSRENVEESKYYIMIRHRLQAQGFTGYLHVVHATQVYHLVDPTFRRTAGLKLFKDYPDEPNDYQLIARMVGEAGLAKLLELSVKLYASNSPEQQYEAINSAIAVFKRFRRLVKATPGKDTLLEKVQHATVTGEDEDKNATPTPQQLDYALHALKRIIAEAKRRNLLKPNGNRLGIMLGNSYIWLQRDKLEQVLK